jgi:cell wall-associated NlpC family hydrolase
MAGYSVTYTVVDQATAQINAINKRIQQLRAPLEAQAKTMSKFIDVSGLRAVENGFKAIGGAALSAAQSVGRMVPALGAITSATTLAGLGKLVTDFGDMAIELTKTGLLLDETPEKLSGVAQAMRSVGGNAQTAIEALKELRNTAYDAAIGLNGTAAYAFHQAGIALVDFNGNLRDTIDIEADVLKHLDAIPNAMDRQREALRLGGQALADTYLQYKAMNISTEEFIKREKAMQTLTAERTRSLREMELSMATLNTAFYDLGATISGAVAPALSEVFGELAGYLREHKGEISAEIERMGKAFENWVKSGAAKQMAEDFGAVLGVVLKLVEALASLVRYLGDVRTRLNGMPTAEDILNESPLAKGLSDEDKRRILEASPGAHATPELFPGVGGETAKEREARIRNQLGVPGGPPPGVNPNQPYGTATIPPAGGAAAPTPAPTPTPAPGPQSAAGGAPAAFKQAIEDTERGGPGGYYNNAPTPGHSATGPRQMMPATFDENKLPGERIDNPEDNRRVSDRLIDKLWKKYGGDPQKVAYAYANGSTSSPDRNPGYSDKVMSYYSQRQATMPPPTAVPGPTAPTPNTMASAPNTPGGGAAAGVVDQMVALAGTRGAAVREFLRDPNGKIARDPDLGLWCAEFTQSYLRHLGIVGPGGGKNLMAASFATWGQEVAKDQIQKGDVLLNTNLKHVGVSTGRTWLNTPGHKPGDVEEISSNSIGPNGELLNIPGTRWRSDVTARRSQELAIAEAKGAAGNLVAGGGTPNGGVDVTVTHKNAPADVSVAATAYGTGLTLGAPRVEHQQFGQI